MQVPGQKIASYLQKLLKSDVKKLGKKNRPKLVVFLAKEEPDQLSFVKIKQKIAHAIGADFELVKYQKTPLFQEFVTTIRNKSHDQKTTSTIIQQPLPPALSTDSIYNYIPDTKEIEGVKKKSPFFPPIGLAVLTVIKYIYGKGQMTPDLFVNLDKDKTFFKKLFKNKKVILIGRGVTGGKPIGKVLSMAKINYFSINSMTPEPENYYKTADLIISAVGKKILTGEMLKPGVVLINVGMRHEGGRLKGDYDEKDVKDIASVYTITPGGVGPIDVLYLYKNLVDSAKLQR